MSAENFLGCAGRPAVVSPQVVGPRPQDSAGAELRSGQASVPPRAAVVRATPRGTRRQPPSQVNGRPAGRKWTSPLARTRGGTRARVVFIEEPRRRTWSSMCVLCKKSDGRLNQLTRDTLRFRPASMQMRRRRDQWRAQGRAQRARSRFPLCDSGGRPGGGGGSATGTCGFGRLRRRPGAPSDGPREGPRRGRTRWSGEWRGAGRWREPGQPRAAYVTGGSDSWSWGPAPEVANRENGCNSA